VADRIEYHRYTLESKTGLNSSSSRTKHEGILIRVNGGYGCIHPWPELADVPVDKQLAELAEGHKTPLAAAALNCAKFDAEARAKGVSLFEGLQVPDSYGTVVGGMSEIEAAVLAGFSSIKLKGTKDVAAGVALLEEASAKFPALRYRIDFNCNLSGSEVGEYVDGLSEAIREKIDYLEDPCGYTDSCWVGLRSLYGVRLAMDIGVESIDASYSYAVIKPAKNNVFGVMEKTRAEGRRAVITSYMDHPVGQAYAAWCAGVANKKFMGVVGKCGLMTHHLYLDNPFSEQLGPLQPKWTHKSGTGLGFDDLLDDLDWEVL